MTLFFSNLIARFKDWRIRRQQLRIGDGLDVQSQLPKLSDDEARERVRQMLRDDLKRHRLQRGERPKW